MSPKWKIGYGSVCLTRLWVSCRYSEVTAGNSSVVTAFISVELCKSLCCSGCLSLC